MLHTVVDDRTSPVLAAIIIGVLMLTQSGSAADDSSANGVDQFRLMILKAQTGVHKYEEILPGLQTARLEDSLLTLRMDDIESYDWDRQGLTLTPKASIALVEVLPLKKEDRDETRNIIRQEGSPCWAGPLELVLNLHKVAVNMGDQLIYGGIFLEPTSQRPVNYPVLRVAIVKGRIRFSVLPVHIPFLTFDPGLSEAKTWNDAISPQAQGDWSQLPDEIKRKFFERQVRDSHTESFRKLIQDPRIRTLTEKAGKLLAMFPAEQSIGVATMLPDGTIVLTLRATDSGGIVGDAQLLYPPAHPEYKEILRHVGDLKPGMEKPVMPWPEKGK